MKLFSLLFGAIMANPMMNFLLMDKMLDDDSDSTDVMTMMLLSPGLLGQNQQQADQMNPLLPFLLMDSDDSDDNTKVSYR